jgi:hypothetical protein
MFSRVILIALALASASAQTFDGSGMMLQIQQKLPFDFGLVVTNTLPATVGACGRRCNRTITCTLSGHSEICSGADAAVHYDVFFAYVSWLRLDRLSV